MKGCHPITVDDVFFPDKPSNTLDVLVVELIIFGLFRRSFYNLDEHHHPTRIKMGSLKTRRRRNANLRFLAMMVGLLVVALAGGSMMKNSGSVTSLSDTQKSSSSSALFVYRRFLVEEEPEETKEEHKDKEEEKEGEDGEGEDGEDGEAEFEEEFELVDLRVVISIIVLLIVLTVAFEVGKETIEESVPEDYGVILEKFFGELTILGFLSMVTFLVSQFGVMAQVSELVYGEEEELQEKFE